MGDSDNDQRMQAERDLQRMLAGDQGSTGTGGRSNGLAERLGKRSNLVPLLVLLLLAVAATGYYLLTNSGNKGASSSVATQVSRPSVGSGTVSSGQAATTPTTLPPTAKPVPTATAQVTITTYAVITNTDGVGVFVRVQPAADAGWSDRLPEGVEVGLLAETTEVEGVKWQQVQSSGTVGWVESRYLERRELPTTISTATPNGG